MNTIRSEKGSVDAGPWRFLRPLGKGGEGEVFLAEHRKTKRRAAVKVIDGATVPLDAIRPSLEILRRLGQVAAQPNLARLMDFHLDGDEAWVASEYVAGTSLAGLVASDEGLDPYWAVNMLIDGAYGLAALHEAGVLHGDVKPANLILGTDGRSRWIDFSSIRVISDGEREPREDGWSFHGTAAYASPEQLRDAPQGPKSDLWSFGVLAWEALTGRRLFAGSWPHEVYGEMLELEKRDLAVSDLCPGLPPEIDEIVEGLLRIDERSRRFDHALELAEALERVALRRKLGCFHRGLDRRRMRQDLAETTYWRCVNALEEGREDEALRLLDCLRKLPATSRDRYRSHLAAVLRRRLREPSLLAGIRSGCVRTLELAATMTGRLLAIAHRLKDQDGVAIASRRLATILGALPSDEDRLGRLQELLLGFGRDCVILLREAWALAKAMGRDAFAASVHPMLCKRLIELGDVRSLEELLPEGAPSRRSESMLGRMEELRRGRERFAVRWVGLMTHGRFEEATSLALAHLAQDRGDLRAMAAFCRRPRTRLAAIKARELRAELGRRAFLRGDFDLVREVFRDRIREGKGSERALAYLLELALMEGRDLSDVESDAGLSILLAAEPGGHALPCEGLVEAFFLHGRVEEELDLLVATVGDAGMNALAGELEVMAGLTACRQERFSEGRRRILAGLALRHHEGRLVTRVEAEPMARRAFSALEWLLLRRRKQVSARRRARSPRPSPVDWRVQARAALARA